MLGSLGFSDDKRILRGLRHFIEKDGIDTKIQTLPCVWAVPDNKAKEERQPSATFFVIAIREG